MKLEAVVHAFHRTVLAMQEAAPRRELNLLQTVAIIIGVVIGSGVFISLPIVARASGSSGMSILIWFLGGVAWIPQVLILAELGTAYPIQGGPYFYLHKAGSPFLGFLYTWTAFLTSDTPTLTIIGLTAVSALTVFSPVFAHAVYAKVFAGTLIVALAVVHVRSVRTGGNLQIILTAAKLMPLMAIVLVGLFQFASGKTGVPVEGTDIHDRGLGVLLIGGISSTLWSYAGFTNILYMAGEVKDPGKTLPRAIIGGLVFVTIAYTLIAACTTAVVPFTDLVASEGEFVNPFLYVASLKDHAAVVFAVAVFVSMIGVLNASIMSQPRLEYGMARDGHFFSVFGHLHPRFLTPDYSILIQSGLGVLLLVFGNIEDLLGYFTISYTLQNGLMYGALLFLRKRADYAPAYRTPLPVLMVVIAIATQLFVGGGAFVAYPAAGAIASLFLIGSGLPIYLYFHSRQGQTVAVVTPGRESS